MHVKVHTSWQTSDGKSFEKINVVTMIEFYVLWKLSLYLMMLCQKCA